METSPKQQSSNLQGAQVQQILGPFKFRKRKNRITLTNYVINDERSDL